MTYSPFLADDSELSKKEARQLQDALLAKLNLEGSALVAGENPYLDSLRAIVELHAPFQYKHYKKLLCKDCSESTIKYAPYPCPTIQIINTNLK